MQSNELSNEIGTVILKDLCQQKSSYSSTPEHVGHGKQEFPPEL